MKLYGDYHNFFTEFAQRYHKPQQSTGAERESYLMGKIHELTLFTNPNSADRVSISQEALAYMKGNPDRTENVQDYAPMPHQEQELYDHIQSHLNTTALSTIFTGPEIIAQDLWNAYKEAQSKEEDYLDVNSHVENLKNAYADIYSAIVKGYEDGTREVWVKEDNTADDFSGIEFMNYGRVERYRKLTMEEEIAALDKAYEKYAEDIEERVNYANMIEKVSPSALETMRELREISKERFDRNTMHKMEQEENAVQERKLEEIAEKIGRPERIAMYGMFMDAREAWIELGNVRNLFNVKEMKGEQVTAKWEDGNSVMQ